MYLAENMRKIRKEKRLTQSELAEKVGSHLSHINRIETGKYVPSLETVISIAKALDVTLDFLIFSSDGVAESIQLADQHFSEKIRLLNSLEEEDKQVVTKVIDAFLTKRKMLDLLTPQEVHA